MTTLDDLARSLAADIIPSPIPEAVVFGFRDNNGRPINYPPPVVEQPTTSLPHTLVTNLIPFEYVLHHHTEVCDHCKHQSSYSRLYAHNLLRPREGSGHSTYIENLHSVKTPTYNLPVRVVDLPPAQTLYCRECIHTADLSALPTPPDPTPRRIVAAAPTNEAKAKAKSPSTKKIPTLDDVLALL